MAAKNFRTGRCGAIYRSEKINRKCRRVYRFGQYNFLLFFVIVNSVLITLANNESFVSSQITTTRDQVVNSIFTGEILEFPETEVNLIRHKRESRQLRPGCHWGK